MDTIESCGLKPNSKNKKAYTVHRLLFKKGSVLIVINCATCATKNYFMSLNLTVILIYNLPVVWPMTCQKIVKNGKSVSHDYVLKCPVLSPTERYSVNCHRSQTIDRLLK